MQDLVNFIRSNPRNQWNRTVRKNKIWITWLLDQFPDIESLNERLWLLHIGATSRPTCAVDECYNEVKWINNDHYGETCSYKCSQQLRKQHGRLDSIQAKMQMTSIARYGTPSPASSQEIKTRRAETMLAKYGAKVSPKTRESTRARSAELNVKGRKTIRQRYGVDNPQQVPEIRAKTVQTFIDRYGTTNVSGIDAVKARKNQARQERWDALFSNVTILGETVPSELREQRPYANLRVSFRCTVCEHEEELPSETLKYRHTRFGNACSQCCKISANSSRDEALIADLVAEMGIRVIRNDRTVIAPRELDIWLPDQRMAIEYCGLYWHSENRDKGQDYHASKMRACADIGVRLITIFEDEWHHRPHVVISRLSNLLGSAQDKIMARKCTVREIASKEANMFCDRNHLQGAGRTAHAVGLYHENSLVSCMTFSRLNIAKGRSHKPGTWELSRFCSLIDTNIVGGASRLFNNFIRQHDPSEIVSYADLRWNTGDVYQKLGFKLDGQTSPNYWYINMPEVKRLHRYGLRKNDQDRQDLTEWENRKLQGWDRIWDCGNSRWIWSKE
jgi:hypothetical protein